MSVNAYEIGCTNKSSHITTKQHDFSNISDITMGLEVT